MAFSLLLLLLAAFTFSSCQNTDLTAGGPIAPPPAAPGEPIDECPAPPIDSFPVRINEVMIENTSTLEDEAGQFSPWVELYNPGSAPLDLGGVWLSDDLSDDKKWEIPCTAGATIPPGGFVVIFLDGDTENADDLHAPFTLHPGQQATLVLNAGSDFVVLDGSELLADQTFGRFPDGTGSFTITEIPTPYSANEVKMQIVFVRGDVDAGGSVDVTDLDLLLEYLKGEGASPTCLDRLDINDDGTVDVSDGSVLARELAAGTPTIPAPYPGAGIDPTLDTLPECKEE